MNQDFEKGSRAARRSSPYRRLAIGAAVLALIQACSTVEGMGIEGFLLWVLILFLGYWLLFSCLYWLWRRLQSRGQ